MPAVRAWLVAAALGAVVLMLPRSADDGSWGWLLDGGLVVRRAPPRPAWPAAPRSLAHPERWNVHRDFPRRCGMAAPPLPEATRRFVDELWRLMPDIIPRGFASAHAVWEEHVCMYDCLDRLRRELERSEAGLYREIAGFCHMVRVTHCLCLSTLCASSSAASSTSVTAITTNGTSTSDFISASHVIHV